MLSLIFRFIGYAREMLKQGHIVKYVPALHCNQSSIEGLFSHIRVHGKDRKDLYGMGFMQQNISGLMRKIKRKRNLHHTQNVIIQHHHKQQRQRI